ncbi:MAG: calcium-translocating P-type ATPase, PMCA-type [Ruminococcaceae bacterium]|nr:calcium-translocating P-type ATPase, PMCA-type [Oscillospiraceae bacterium]
MAAEKKIYAGGLTEDEVRRSRQKYGENSIRQKKKKSFGRMVWESLSDPIIRILLGALSVNLIFTYRNINWAESGGILAAVLIATLVSVISERSGERAFEKMNDIAKRQSVSVLRHGKWQSIPVIELVVGDVVRMGAGERVPADAMILEGELRVDQSALNGESKAVLKRADPDMQEISALQCGSMVLYGTAISKITAVGENTVYGRIAAELQETARDSPMKQRLSQLAKVISRIGYVAAATVSIVYLLNTLVLDCSSSAQVLAGLRDYRYLANALLKALTIGITVIVVAVPEGLPMMLTVVLSANMKRMYRDKVLVRKPIGIETAGSMNILFCDKTGTLTTGNLSVEAIYTADLTRITSAGALRERSVLLRHYMLQAYYNTEAYFEEGNVVGGNATERALLRFAGRGKPIGVTVTHRMAFDSRYKYSYAAIEGMNQPLYCIKGAAEKLLPKCSFYLDEKGERHPLLTQKPITETIKEISMALGRVILLCESEQACFGSTVPDGLTLVALVAMRDEIRREVPQALRSMKEAGVNTVMVTGDSKETAIAIAMRCGILTDHGDECVLTSSELAELGDTELCRLLPRLRVLARALPQDKSRLVRVAQSCGMVVGMTGDGVNDAPALKMADVGFAMGSGTDVAREAGDVVILDCNFASIVKAVLYGRTIFKSVRKFIVFQLTMNLCAVGVSLFGQMVGIETPVTVIQMLWVNIIMDTLGGLAFAGEAPRHSYMKEPPKRRDEPILDRKMIQKTLIMGAYTVFLSTVFLFSPRIRSIYRFAEDPGRLLSAFFALFIFSGIMICFTARSDDRGLFSGIGANRAFIVIMLVILFVQLLMLYFGGSTFRCVPLTLSELTTVILLSATVLPVDWFRRIFVLLAAARAQ